MTDEKLIDESGLSILINWMNQKIKAESTTNLQRYTTVLLANSWTYSSTNQTYEQTQPISGLVYADTIDVIADVNVADIVSPSAVLECLENWGLVTNLYLDENGLHAVCHGSSPSVNIPLVLRVTGGVYQADSIQLAAGNTF